MINVSTKSVILEVSRCSPFMARVVKEHSRDSSSNLLDGISSNSPIRAYFYAAKCIVMDKFVYFRTMNSEDLTYLFYG